MTHTEWVTKVTKGDSARGIGRTAGISFRTIADQIERGKISAENVIAVAIGYNAHPVTALVDTGYLPAEYLRSGDPVAALRLVSEDALAEEVLRRMRLVGDHTAFTTPVDDLARQREHSGPESAADALEARRREAAGEVDDRLRRHTRARSGDRGENPPSLSK